MGGLLKRSPQPMMVIRTRPVVDLDDEQFFRFCAVNRKLQTERNADSDMIITQPDDPAEVLGEPVLPGFVLDVRAIWRAMASDA